MAYATSGVRPGKMGAIMITKLSRRDFLRLSGAMSTGLALSACGVELARGPDPAATPSFAPSQTATSAPASTVRPAPVPTATPTPAPTSTAMPAPTMTSLPAAVEQLPQTRQALVDFVQAFQAAGVDVPADKLLQEGLGIRSISAKDGKQYYIAYVHIERSVRAGVELGGDYPLMIKKKESWEEITTRIASEVAGFPFGTTFDGYEGAIRDERYRSGASRHFSVIYTGGQLLPRQVNWGSGENAARFAAVNDISLYVHPGFWPLRELDEVRNSSPDEIRSYIETRIDRILAIVNTAKVKGKPVYLNFVNEGFWSYRGNSGMYKDTDKPPNPFYKAYGKNWIAELYLLHQKRATENGIVVGKELVMIHNEAEAYYPGKKLTILLEELLKDKTIIAERLGVPKDQVQLDVGLQLHMSPSPDNSNYFKIPSDKDFMKAIDQLFEVGYVHLTECDVRDVSKTEQQRILAHFMDLALKSGKVRQMVIFNALRFVKPYDKTSPFENGYTGLIGPDYRPSGLYFLFTKILMDSLS
jgi:hypothetical protein